MPPQQTPNNPYGFITNPEKPAPPPMFGGENSTLKRALIVGVGFVLLIMIFIIGSSFLNSASNAQTQKLLGVAQTQTEIIRIAEASEDKPRSGEVAALNYSTRLSTQSAIQNTLAALQQRGKKIKSNDKQLALGQNPQNDEILTEAETNSRFDEAYLALLSQQLENYQIQLTSAYDSGSASEKEMLSSAYEQSELIKNHIKLLAE